MAKTELEDKKAKPQGYVLTDKGKKAAGKADKWPNSLGDVVLQTMANSPGKPLTKASLSDDFWRTASDILAKLEEEGLVEKVDVASKTKVVMGDAFKPTKVDFPGTRKQTVPKLTRDVYSDRPGTRLARRRVKGWHKVKH